MALVKISRGADIQHNYVNGVSRVSVLEGTYKDATVERISLQPGADFSIELYSRQQHNQVFLITAGKGYIVRTAPYVVVVGGVNMDIGGTPLAPLVRQDSNPGRVRMSLGGVGRNIAHNMALLGLDVRMITALGDDVYAQKITASCIELGINLAHSLQMPGASTSTYLFLTDEKGDMELAVSDMEIYDHLTPQFLAGKETLLNHARLVICDANIPEPTLAWIGSHCKAPVFVDPVSTAKAVKVKPVLGRLHTLKPNRIEAELLSGQSLQAGAVRIAASGLALQGCLLRVLARYCREFPHVRICLTNHSTPQGLAAVQNGLADLAVVSEGSIVPDSLVKQKVAEVQEVPVCGAGFSQLAGKALSLAELADHPIICLTSGTSSHTFYADLFRRCDLPFCPDIEVETVDQVLPVVRSDLGIGFVPREMLLGSPELTGIYPLTLAQPIPPRSIYLFQRKNQPLSMAAQQLRRMLLQDEPGI